jgi:hypothetical protein
MNYKVDFSSSKSFIRTVIMITRQSMLYLLNNGISNTTIHETFQFNTIAE